jgi:very-short-patch-repair endonuclease
MRRPGIANARSLRRRSTDAELRMWYLLRDRRLADYKFRRQVPVGPWIVDFLCVQARLVVEVDGGQHSGSRHDASRDNDLVRRGYRIVRYWNHEVLGNTEGVLLDLLRTLRGEADA